MCECFLELLLHILDLENHDMKKVTTNALQEEYDGLVRVSQHLIRIYELKMTIFIRSLDLLSFS